MKIKSKNILVILIGSLFLLYLGFYNNYPFVYSDTGTYIRSGIKCIIPIDRPVYYGLFIRHFSLLTSLWYVVFAQSLIISYLLFFIFKYFFYKNYRLYFLISVIVLTLTTSVSFHISQIMPDIFTSVSILSFFVLLVVKPIKIIDNIIISTLFIFSIFTHNSHLYIILLLLLFVLTLCLFKKRFGLEFINYKKIVHISVLYLITLILIPTCNYLISNSFFYSKASDIFLFQKMYDIGILDKYLKENCENKNYNICIYKDSLPYDILWDSRSPLNKTGNWLDVKDECHTINMDILRTPKYFKLFFLKTIQSTLKQFFHFSLDESAYNTESEIEINNYYKHEIREFYSSMQVNNKLNFKFLNYIQLLIFFISFISFFIFLSNKLCIYETAVLKFSIYFILISLVANAFVCSTFSCVIDRYQSRVVWLIPVFLLIIVFKWFDNFKENHK